MIKYIMAALAVYSLIFVYGCKKDPGTMPPDSSGNNTCEFPTGNRNFSWQMDSVALFPSTLGGIWAFSDSDAYLMGDIYQWTDGVFTGYAGLHWNGKVWEKNLNGTFEEIYKHIANDVTGDDHFMVSVGYWYKGNEKAGLGEFDNRTKKWKGYQFQTPGELYSVWTDGKGFFVAGGTDGMVYTKDGYTSGWVYTKAPTDFNFTKVKGTSKSEIYFLGSKSYVTGEYPGQLWKYKDNKWTKLLDNHDTTGTPVKIPEVTGFFYDLSVYRCSQTDSLYIYLAGHGIYELKSHGSSEVFSKTTFVSRGFPIQPNELPSMSIKAFSPNDIWTGGLQYKMYHWNGKDFMKIEPISYLPYGQFEGIFMKFSKTSSGKIWMILELGSQVYAVVQGTPYK
ncbi:MAG TPA: hypothetical protein VHO03_18340 [Ignavibacteriales bacterium]|nr:hypothetical protein [Ignavibacteriales bacterium]